MYVIVKKKFSRRNCKYSASAFSGFSITFVNILSGFLPIMPGNVRDKAGTNRDKQGQEDT